MDRDLLIRKLDWIIGDFVFARSYQKNKHVNHFVALRKRLIENKKLTKKMQENLSWIDKTVVLK